MQFWRTGDREPIADQRLFSIQIKTGISGICFIASLNFHG